MEEEKTKEYMKECCPRDEPCLIEILANKAAELLFKYEKKIDESTSNNKLSKDQVTYALKGCMEEYASFIIKAIKNETGFINKANSEVEDE